MSLARLDPEAVSARLREIAQEELLGRFRNLAAHEIREKEPGDPVTVADEAAERRLHAALTDLLPGSLVVGEEGTSADPAAFRHLKQERDPVWIIDPLDGTANFARGDERFASLVALTRAGRILMGWVCRPVGDVMAVAVEGGGAAIDGETARIPGDVGPLDRATAFLSWTRRPFDLRAVSRRLQGLVGEVVEYNCAGLQYLDIVRGQIRLGFFTRLMPWDHAAGVLLVSEAGGYAAHLDGRAYDLDPGRAGLMVAAGEGLWREAHGLLMERADVAAAVRGEAAGQGAAAVS